MLEWRVSFTILVVALCNVKHGEFFVGKPTEAKNLQIMGYFKGD